MANHIPAAEPSIFGVSRCARATTSLLVVNMANLHQGVARKCPVKTKLTIELALQNDVNEVSKMANTHREIDICSLRGVSRASVVVLNVQRGQLIDQMVATG